MTIPRFPPDRARRRRPLRPGPALGVVALLALLVAAPGFTANDPFLVVPNPKVVIRSAINPKTRDACGAEGRLVFSISRAANMSIPTLPDVGTTLDGVAIGGSPDIPVPAGRHVLAFNGSVLTSPVSTVDLQLRVKDANTGHLESETITFLGDVVNRSILPVGRIFLQGIDLMVGHVVMTTTDIKVPGRHLALDVGRTYAGSPGAPGGPTGARWTFTHESRLTPIDDCGLYVVSVGGGSSQTFGTADHGRTFVPEPGYHTSLKRLPDGSFDFVDKAANRFHFAGPDASGERARRLLYFEEPHGDRLVYRYDRQGRLIEVIESQVVTPAVRLVARTLRLSWIRVGGFDRVRSISAPGLGLQVEYDYDDWGNLLSAAKQDTDLPGLAVDRMAYSSDLGADRHRLLSFSPATGSRIEYKYSGNGQVQEIAERPAKGGLVSTTFKFEKLPSPAIPFRVTTRTGNLPTEIYDLRADGREARTEFSDVDGRRTETVVWASEDVLKVSQSNNRGGETVYAYDVRGNLIRETTRRTAQSPPKVVISEYHPRFNFLVRQVDANGGVSTWTLDPRTGDLLESRDPKGVVEKYRHDAYGRVTESETAAGKTLYLAHDTFGSATRIRLPSGKIEIPEYDARGRRYADDQVPPEK